MTIAALRRLIDEESAAPALPAAPSPQTNAEKRNPMSQQQPPVPQSPAPSAGAPPISVGKLLSWAEAHDTKFVSRKGAQARLLLLELRGLYAADEERAAVAAEEQRLLQQLEAVRARQEQLRPRRKSPTPGYDQATVREWARENGYTVAQRGSIPTPIVDAWRAAQ